MKVIKKKSFTVNIVAPETKEEDEAIKKIIADVKKENKKPFNPDEWESRKPGDS